MARLYLQRSGPVACSSLQDMSPPFELEHVCVAFLSVSSCCIGLGLSQDFENIENRKSIRKNHLLRHINIFTAVPLTTRRFHGCQLKLLLIVRYNYAATEPLAVVSICGYRGFCSWYLHVEARAFLDYKQYRKSNYRHEKSTTHTTFS